MNWFVYIIQSEVDGTYYKGYTTDYMKRIEEHNAGMSKYTSTKMPWKICYVEICATKTDAIKRELMLKDKIENILNGSLHSLAIF